jgi:hypothetical protein
VHVSGFAAVAPGTDLSQHARELVRIHDAVLAGQRAPVRPRELVSRSWRRVLSQGLDPDRANLRDPLPAEEVERRRRASPLSLVIGDLSQGLTAVADASLFLMVVTDADGVILWREGATSVRMRADRLGFAEGAEWTEARVGTNAIGTALAEAAPVQLFSAEHFEQAQHPWYCTAAPIHDPRTGDLLGIVDVSGPALTLHPAIGALVETSVRLAESQLWHHHEQRLERLRRSAAHVIAAVPGPMLLVDDHGWVAHHHGITVRSRISVPRPDKALAVPGLGLCIPERVSDGWLVRPAGTPGAGAGTVHARLDLTGAPVLEVRGEGEPWRTPLTRRHAEILTLLHRAGAAGLSAGRLSVELYGDAEHAVSVRAEISRMRRVVGGLLETNPYRLARDVTLDVVPAPAG